GWAQVDRVPVESHTTRRVSGQVVHRPRRRHLDRVVAVANLLRSRSSRGSSAYRGAPKGRQQRKKEKESLPVHGCSRDGVPRAAARSGAEERRNYHAGERQTPSALPPIPSAATCSVFRAVIEKAYHHGGRRTGNSKTHAGAELTVGSLAALSPPC